MANMRTMQPVTKMWYDYLNEGKLMGLKCEHCGQMEFPPVPVCNTCGKHEMEWAPITGRQSLSATAGLRTAPLHIGESL